MSRGEHDWGEHGWGRAWLGESMAGGEYDLPRYTSKHRKVSVFVLGENMAGESMTRGEHGWGRA